MVFAIDCDHATAKNCPRWTGQPSGSSGPNSRVDCHPSRTSRPAPMGQHWDQTGTFVNEQCASELAISSGLAARASASGIKHRALPDGPACPHTRPPLVSRKDHRARNRRPEVVRGGIEPPAFRFSGGIADPGGSRAVRLTSSSLIRAVLSVYRDPLPSRTVVSNSLARSPKSVAAS
jgi:hypothetical protein